MLARSLVALGCLLAGSLPLAASSPLPRAALDAYVDELETKGAPGCALGLIRDGQLAYARGFGLASLEHGVPMTTGTVLDIGSTSKQFTAAAVLLLVQDGKLSLDDDIRELIPEIPAYGTPVTVRHLLHHTSGLRDYIELLALSGINLEDVCTDADALAMLGRQKALDFRPGSEHSYSNSGYFLLSILVERTSGKALADFARERIFEPLGMRHTLILNDHTRVIPRRAAAYAKNDEGDWALNASSWEQTGDGAVQTTVEDLVLWDRNFYDPKVGGAELVRELQVGGKLDDGTALDYARGLRVSSHRGLRTVDHAGAWAGYRAQMLRFPDQKLTAIALCNFAESDPVSVAQRLAEIVLEEQLAPLPAATAASAAAGAAAGAAAPAAELDGHSGLYFSESSNLVRRLLVRDGKLIYARSNGSESELLPEGQGRFLMAGTPTPTRVSLDSNPGEPRQMEVRSGDGPPTRFVEVSPAKLDGEQLARLTGTYQSAELATTWKLSIEAGKLTATGPRGPGMPLEPAFDDAFLGPPGLLRLHRAPDGRVDGFELSVGRARRIGFSRLPG